MGLPEILIEFKTKAETAVTRSQNGIVAVVLADDSKTGDEYASYSYSYEADIIKAHWSATNLDYLNKIFMGKPKRVIVERIGVSDNYEMALARLKNKKWNWLTIPGIEKRIDDVQTIQQWISEQRAAKKTFKAVLPATENTGGFNDEGIVEFSTDGVKVGAKNYTVCEYCARIAGLLAGLSMTESATYQVLAEVNDITESLTPDDDIDDGKLILVNDGEKIKVGRGVNSLHILSGEKTADMKKIKIIEGMDLMRDDIRTTFEENYIGINNSYDNKVMFAAAVNQYFDSLMRQGVLYDVYENIADIDVNAQREWLAEKYDISDYTDDQIRKAKTGSYVFLKANVQFADAIEDLHFAINME
jgi:hypothetical protein|nr:MAG TPA: tail protein [Caudoviricetes sp.]